MSSLSYSILPIIKEHLHNIEESRKRIVLTPLNPRLELRLSWEAKMLRVYYSLLLSGVSVNKKDLANLLSSGSFKKLTKEENQVLKLAHGYEKILRDWLVTSEALKAETILNIHKTACIGKEKGSLKEFRALTDYLRMSHDHPVVQAAVVYIQILKLNYFTDGNGSLARLLSYLFLYKFGYDFRGFLVFEEYWYSNHSTYMDILKSSLRGENITYWIVYFSKTIELSLQSVELIISDSKVLWKTDIKDSFFVLSERQKEILSFLDNPNQSITNRKVQSLFKTSQITASRDLAKLLNLGLLFAHGKGRSVYYTRV